jgi:AmiR/NasT family two-component response regulator
VIDETVLEDEPEWHLGWRKSRDLPPIRIGAKLVCLGTNVNYRETEHLRVLIANERRDRLALVAPIVAALGHEVIAREIEVEDVGAVTARERPDVALVGLGESSAHALTLIEKIVRESACPVIVLLHAPDADFVREASKRGVFAYITDADAKDWQSSIDIVLRRFAEYHELEGAFGRRAQIERAKGILMERHSVDEASAFELLREQSRSSNRKLVDVANGVVDGHRLLPKEPQAALAEAASPERRKVALGGLGETSGETL